MEAPKQKQCTQCRSEIDSRAVRCPHCQSSQGWRQWALVAYILLAVVFTAIVSTFGTLVTLRSQLSSPESDTRIAFRPLIKGDELSPELMFSANGHPEFHDSCVLSLAYECQVTNSGTAPCRVERGPAFGLAVIDGKLTDLLLWSVNDEGAYLVSNVVPGIQRHDIVGTLKIEGDTSIATVNPGTIEAWPVKVEIFASEADVHRLLRAEIRVFYRCIGYDGKETLEFITIPNSALSKAVEFVIASVNKGHTHYDSEGPQIPPELLDGVEPKAPKTLEVTPKQNKE